MFCKDTCKEIAKPWCLLMFRLIKKMPLKPRILSILLKVWNNARLKNDWVNLYHLFTTISYFSKEYSFFHSCTSTNRAFHHFIISFTIQVYPIISPLLSFSDNFYYSIDYHCVLSYQEGALLFNLHHSFAWFLFLGFFYIYFIFFLKLTILFFISEPDSVSIILLYSQSFW